MNDLRDRKRESEGERERDGGKEREKERVKEKETERENLSAFHEQFPKPCSVLFYLLEAHH